MMGSLARLDDYLDPMTGLPTGGAIAQPEAPQDPAAFTADWARISGQHPQAFEPQGTQWPQYPPPPPKEVAEDKPNPLIPFSAYRSKPPTHRVGDIAAQNIIEQGFGALPAGRLGMGTALTLTPTEAQAVKLPKFAPEMGFGHVPHGTNKQYLLRYAPDTGGVELVNSSGPTGHAFSTIKTGMKPEQMSRVVANEPNAYTYPLLDMAKLKREKAELIFGPTDRMYGGGELTHVNKQKLDVPVKQEGGPNFPHLNRDAVIPNIPADAAPLYASVTESAAKKPLEVATAVRERGGVPYYVPVIMTHGGGDSSKQIANTGHQLLRQSEPSADAVAKINSAIAAKGGNAPDFADREAFQKWLDSGLPARTAFSKGLDTKEILKATGVDMGPIRYANTDPRLYSTPSGSAGIIMGEMRPELGTSRAPLHSNYPVTFFGQRDNIGGMAGNMPYSLLAPDQHRAMVPLHNRGISFATTPAMQHMRGLAGSIPKTQPVTQEVVDNYYEWFRRHPSGWMAAGAAPLGALAATGDYQPEEKM